MIRAEHVARTNKDWIVLNFLYNSFVSTNWQGPYYLGLQSILSYRKEIDLRLDTCWAYSSILIVEAVFISERSMTLYQITGLHIPEDKIL
jgi:hypothetical protein